VRITKIEFKDFRGFQEETLEIGEQDTIVFAGPNGSGKSSVLAAVGSLLSNVVMLLAGKNEAQFLTDDEINVRSGRDAAEWGFYFQLGDQIDNIFTGAGKWDSGKPVPPSTWGLLHQWSQVLESQGSDQITVPAFSYLHSGSTRSVPRLPLPDEGFWGRLFAYLGAFDQEAAHFEDFEKWYEAEENIENEQRIWRRKLDLQHPPLRAVREAVRRFLEHLRGERLADLRVVRTHLSGPFGAVVGRLTIEKDGTPLYLDQLSDGERRLILLVGDVARRMAILNPHLDDPTASPGVLLADEIDLHLHPGWQRRVMPALRAAFPTVQLIVTTHSPQVLASVPSEAVVMMKDFKFLPGHPKTFGRDTNTLLDTVFEVPERPEEIMAQLRTLYKVMKRRPAQARALYEELRQTLEEDDPELARIETLLMLAEG
jgi:ABC-type cobalamin/Fe3+-siderophores transport system ATPase subunit